MAAPARRVFGLTVPFHGLRLTDQISAESAVSKAAKPAKISGMMYDTTVSDSRNGQHVHILFHVGKF